MKKTTVLLFLALLTTLSLRADVIFQDALDYPNGLIETDGLWQVYSPSVPKQDCYVENNLLILNSTNADAVAAPFTNDTGSSIIYASFTINVSSLPTQKGGYFEQLMDTNASYNAAGRVFISTSNTVVPGTYQLAVANFTPYVNLANFYPLDLATGITYQVVFSFDTNANDALQGATLAVNPAYESDFDESPAFGTDKTSSAALLAIQIGRIGFSQYTGQGVAAIGNVVVGTSFSDVQTNLPQIPVIGVQPASTNIDSYNPIQLYVAASGLGQLTYQWLSNNVPLVDDGVTVVGSQANVLNLLAPTTTASYSVIVGNSAGTTNSAVAVVTVNTALSVPHFTTQPVGATNALSATVTLSATATGTGPLAYTWYFESTNGGGYSEVTAGTGTSATLTLANLSYVNSGLYFVNFTGGVGSANSATVSVLVTNPPTVSIGYLHSLMITNNPGSYNINGNAIYTVQGVVNSFGPFTGSTAGYAEFYIQDNTGGAYVYIGAAGTNAVPPAGTLVSIAGPVQVYNGQLEIDAQVGGSGPATNGYVIISTNNPLPAVQPVNFSLMATNALGTYGIAIQNALVTVTNAYFYSSKKGAPFVAGSKFYTAGYNSFYFTQGPYNSVSNTNTWEIYTVTYGGAATNLAGQLIPGQAYQVTGVLANYKGSAELDVTRLQDFVTNAPAPFAAAITSAGGVSTLTWPALDGSTYSVLSATNLLGPWIPTFGLSYYPSTGTYTVTNPAAAEFYKVTTP
jgi:DNA/RNA endonuclease YhcR with UshA esterase domain